MAQIKFTKSELRSQQFKLSQLMRYLPTLLLKKAMLQAEVLTASMEVEELTEKYLAEKNEVGSFQELFALDETKELIDAVAVSEVKKNYESIAGVEIPLFKEVVFKEFEYELFRSPLWFDDAILSLRALVCAKEKIEIAKEKKKLLELELREISIRVNLFEKILIPRTLENIKKIKVFLGDQQLAAIAQAKIAKRKIMEQIG